MLLIRLRVWQKNVLPQDSPPYRAARFANQALLQWETRLFRTWRQLRKIADNSIFILGGGAAHVIDLFQGNFRPPDRSDPKRLWHSLFRRERAVFPRGPSGCDFLHTAGSKSSFLLRDGL